MYETSYGFEGETGLKNLPPYFIYKQKVEWTLDPSSAFEATRRNRMPTAVKGGPKQYLCGYGEGRIPIWSKERGNATRFSDILLAQCAQDEAEKRDAAPQP